MLAEKLRAADFLAEIKDNSMINKGLHAGDVIYFARCDTAQSGDIVAAAVGEDVYIRSIWYRKGSVMLSPANSNYSTVLLTGDEVETLRILGKATAYAHELTSENAHDENRDFV